MILLQISIDTSSLIQNTMSESNNSNFWLYIALAEFAIISYSLFEKARKKRHEQFSERDRFFDKSKKSEVDMDEIFDDISTTKEARKYYRKLSNKYHPDKYLDPKLKAKAEIIFQEMAKNKLSLRNLKELQKRAETELD